MKLKRKRKNRRRRRKKRKTTALAATGPSAASSLTQITSHSNQQYEKPDAHAGAAHETFRPDQVLLDLT